MLLGSTGFLGRWIFNLFREDGIEVCGYGSTDIDLQRPEMLEKLEGQFDTGTVLVFASALTPEKGTTLDVFRHNLAMGLNIARYLETHPVGLCVYISSDAVYPFSSNPVTEETPIDPANLYGLGKYVAEQALHHVSKARDIPLLNLRLTALYGPGDTHMSYGPNLFLRSLVREGAVRIFGGGEEKRDHLYVKDAARLIRQLIEKKTTGTFNLATGVSWSFAEVVQILERVVSVPFERTSLPRKVPITHRHFDVARLFLQVPRFQFTPLMEGLQECYQQSCEKQSEPK